MTMPDFLRPFVVPVEKRPADRVGSLDVYYPDHAEPRPAVLLVHGGPVPEAVTPRPRDWPLFQGYGSLLASHGVVAAVVEHGLTDPTRYPVAAKDVAAAVEQVRADPRVDADRIALWFFSGSGLLLTDWLSAPPAWLRCVAASYPLLAVLPGWPVDPHFDPVRALAGAGDLPIVLTRAGREAPQVAEGVAAFVEAAGANLEVVDVPHGQHSFDVLDDTDESRQAVARAVAAVLAALEG